MRNNMTKFFSNQADLEQMDVKSSNLKQSTETFASQSWRLEREARARRNRMYLLIATIVTVFLFLIYSMN